ncbi:MAG: S1 RNA-binding domain-containing protein [Patescibacteria group bacterium]
MSINQQPNMDDLLKHVGSEGDLNVGDKVAGKIIAITKNELLLDIENTGIGIVRGKELYNEEYLSRLNVGEQVDALIINLDNEKGQIECSFRAIGKDKIWREISDAYDSKKTVEAKIREANKGGFLVKVHGVDGFLPASQLAPAHAIKTVVGEEKSLLNQMKKYVGQTFNVKIISINPEADTLVASEKAVSDEISTQKLSKFKVSDVVDATVVGVVDFGVFLRFDDELEGLVHISEIAWKKIDDIKKEIQIGQKVKAKIIEIDKENRINLSIKQTIPNPWIEFVKTVKPGDKFEAKVVKIVSYGAIVTNSNDIQGFVHISQLSETPLESPSKIHEILKVGETKDFTVIDTKEDKLSLSILDFKRAIAIQKELEEKANKEAEEAQAMQTINEIKDDLAKENDVK